MAEQTDAKATLAESKELIAQARQLKEAIRAVVRQSNAVTLEIRDVFRQMNMLLSRLPPSLR